MTDDTTGFNGICNRSGCSQPVYCKVDTKFIKKYLCLKHFKELGDFTKNGRVKPQCQ